METLLESDEESSRPSTARLDPDYNSLSSFGDDGSSKWPHEPGPEPTVPENNEAAQDNRKSHGPENDAMSDITKNLESYSWEELQEKFTKAMNERTRVEKSLQKETAELLEIFTAWSQTTALRDEERAFKRLKTRLSYVQDSESKLEDKKKRYADVIKAFESALALLQTD